MEDDYFEYLQYLRERRRLQIVPRRPRESGNAFDCWSEDQFRARYRFSKSTVLEVIFPLVEDALRNDGRRGNPISPLCKLLGVLRYYATGSFQCLGGDAIGISQPSLSRLVKTVSERFARLLPRFIKYPNEEQLRAVRSSFKRMARFPGVVGCIDCTHVPIVRPPGPNGELFRNRKGYTSINVQVVCGPDLTIYDLVTRWPGSAHDSRIFDNSCLKLRFDNREITGILLGDGGYAQSEYLFTPVLNPQTDPERRYNAAHIPTRTTVERLFGVWKRRFPCLSRKLSTKLSTSTLIISACAVLHNISIIQGELNVPDLDENPLPVENIEIQPALQNRARGRGATLKRQFIEQHFSFRQ